MAPFWCFLAVAGLVIAIAVAWYWRDRALSAERRAEANWDSLGYWRGIAYDLQQQVRDWEDFFDELPANVEDAEEHGPMTEVYFDQRPGAGPENPAQMFNYANEMFYHRLLNWNRKHD